MRRLFIISFLAVTLLAGACSAGSPQFPTATPTMPLPTLLPWSEAPATEPVAAPPPLSSPADVVGTGTPPAGPTPVILAGSEDTGSDDLQHIAETAPLGPPAGDPLTVASQTITSPPPPAVDNSRWGAALAAVPDELSIVGEIISIVNNTQSTAQQVPMVGPQGAFPDTLDLYAWDGYRWSFIPSVVRDRQLSPRLSGDPSHQALATMQVTGDGQTVIGGWSSTGATGVSNILPYLGEMIGGSLIIHPDGTISGEARPLLSDHLLNLAHVAFYNPGPGVQPGLSDDPAAQRQAIDGLISHLVSAGYDGLNLDLRLSSSARAGALTGFISQLDARLQERDLLLTLTLSVAEDELVANEGANIWMDLGRLADRIYLEMPADPRLYAGGGQAESLLYQAVHLIDRRKLSLLLDVRAFETAGKQTHLLSDAEALTRLVANSQIDLAATATLGDQVSARLSGAITSLAWDPAGAAYNYTYDSEGQECHVWLAGNGGLSRKLNMADRFLLRGVILTEIQQQENVLLQILWTGDWPSSMSNPVVVPNILWTVRDGSGTAISSHRSDSLTFVWPAGPLTGGYFLQSDLILGQLSASLGRQQILVRVFPSTATPQPPSISSPTPETPTVEPTTTPEPLNIQAELLETASLYEGPGLAFAKSGQLAAGQVISLTGRTPYANWLRVPVDDSTEGWVLAVKLNILEGANVFELDDISYTPPTLTRATLDSFSLGGQTHRLARPNLMAQSGMQWVKFQHKWTPGESADVVAERIHEAHANGLYVLLSITGKELYPGEIEFAALVTFLGEVASLAPDAIEVWNEANIDREWPAGQIDPAAFVNQLLAPAYQAIKSSNPDVLVISGALAPTGVDDGQHVWADDRFLAGMAAAGAENYLDCVGAHHNAGATSPYALTGHPAGTHYSWYFWPTLRLYSDTFDNQRPVCFTELGYLTAAGFGSLPANFSWAADTTLAQHAQWLAEAAELSRLTGQVGLMIVFNVDLTLWDDDPQAGYAILRPDGSCPACQTLSEVISSG